METIEVVGLVVITLVVVVLAVGVQVLDRSIASGSEEPTADPHTYEADSVDEGKDAGSGTSENSSPRLGGGTRKGRRHGRS